MEWLSSLPAWLVIIVIGASIVLESGFVAGMVLPGTTAVITMGVMAGLGVVPPVAAYAVAILAAVAGPTLGWRTGVSGGPAVRTSKAGQFVGESRWGSAEKVIERRGAQAVIFAQFVVVARTLVPLLVGMSGTSYRRFALVSIPAALTWGAGLTTLGLLAGESYDVVTDALGSATISVAILAGLVLGMAWLGRHFAARPHWGQHPVAQTGRRSLARAQFQVERRVFSAVGPRWAPILSSLVWWLGAVIIGVAAIIVMIWTVRRTPLLALDEYVATWAAAHRSPDSAILGQRISDLLSTPNVLFVAYLSTIVVLVRFRGRLEPGTRVRIITTTLGLAALALATGVVSDAIEHRAEATGVVEFAFDRQLAVVPCALIVALVVARPWLVWRSRVALWTGIAILTTLMLGSRLLSGASTLTEVVVALAVGGAWSVLLASAVRPEHPAEHHLTQSRVRTPVA